MTREGIDHYTDLEENKIVFEKHDKILGKASLRDENLYTIDCEVIIPQFVVHNQIDEKLVVNTASLKV